MHERPISPTLSGDQCGHQVQSRSGEKLLGEAQYKQKPGVPSTTDRSDVVTVSVLLSVVLGINRNQHEKNYLFRSSNIIVVGRELA